MNIAFDAVAILGPMSKNRGIGNYALSQLCTMVDRDEENHYFFLNLLEKDFTLSPRLSHPERLTETFFDTGSEQVLLRDPAYADAVGAVIRRWLFENDIDVFYITSPFESSFTLYKKEWFRGVRVVTTVYDIIPYVMRDKYLTDKTTLQWYMECVENLRWSDRLLVISESVRTDLAEHLGFDTDRIDVIWGAADSCYQRIDIPGEEKRALFQKFGVRGEFIMCTGGEDGRKNLDGLIRAYALLPQDLRKTYQLVIVCKLSEKGLASLLGEARRCGVEQDVVFTNFVSARELLCFYNLASLLAFPSKYEGFGLPITEAWSCGTPVLTADNSSLVQIAGDAAELVDADSDRSIAEGLERVLSSPERLRELTEKGEKRLRDFCWDRVADLAIGFISAIQPLQKELLPAPSGTAAMFTPLPPIRSGISDYSVDIITAMSRFCDVDVFTDTGYTPACTLPENVHVFPHTAYEERKSLYSRTFFQMGNSEYHFYMYPYIRKHHGIVVLHDSNLHGAAYHYAMNLHKGDYGLYEEMLREDYSMEETGAYLSALRGGSTHPAIYEMPLHSFVTAHADAVIVHSEEAKRTVLRQDIARNVTVIPSYAEILPLREAAACRRENGMEEDCILISAFGFIHATKRAMPILHAFARLHGEEPAARLLLAGRAEGELLSEMEHFIAENGLKDAVTITGFLDLAQFKAYIDMTDICLNLRHPSNGETSGSLMRILARGKAVVVNDIGSFSEIPDDACVKLPPVDEMGESREPDYIYDALSRLIRDRAYADSLAEHARRYAEEHLDLNKIAGAYARFSGNRPAPCAVTETLLAALKRDSRLHRSDIPGIADTLAYGKEGAPW